MPHIVNICGLKVYPRVRVFIAPHTGIISYRATILSILMSVASSSRASSCALFPLVSPAVRPQDAPPGLDDGPVDGIEVRGAGCQVHAAVRRAVRWLDRGTHAHGWSHRTSRAVENASVSGLSADPAYAVSSDREVA